MLDGLGPQFSFGVLQIMLPGCTFSPEVFTRGPVLKANSISGTCSGSECPGGHFVGICASDLVQARALAVLQKVTKSFHVTLTCFQGPVAQN